jgi:hypothetical protein
MGSAHSTLETAGTQCSRRGGWLNISETAGYGKRERKPRAENARVSRRDHWMAGGCFINRFLPGQAAFNQQRSKIEYEDEFEDDQ